MPKESKRQLQVGELIRRNFGQVLQAEGSYIYGSEIFVTVTAVKMTPDMGIAKIYVSVFNAPGQAAKEEVLIRMRKNLWRLKTGLVHRIKRHVRRIPHLDVYLDETLDEMYNLNTVFDSLRAQKQLGEEE